MDTRFEKEDIKTLLDRRKEIREEMNKLDREYTAIGNILEIILKTEEKEIDDER